MIVWNNDKAYMCCPSLPQPDGLECEEKMYSNYD